MTTGTDEGNGEDSNNNKKNKNNKRNKKNKEVKYVNPGDALGGSDDEEDTPRIRNPPSYISVYKQFITTVRQGTPGGRPGGLLGMEGWLVSSYNINH